MLDAGNIGTWRSAWFIYHCLDCKRGKLVGVLRRSRAMLVEICSRYIAAKFNLIGGFVRCRQASALPSNPFPWSQFTLG